MSAISESYYQIFDSITLEAAARSDGCKWNRFDPEVIPCWVADMDFPVAEPIRDYLRHIAERGDLTYNGFAISQPCEDFCDRMERRFGWQISPGDMELMSDVVQSFYIGVDKLSEPGDQVILQTPLYHPILNACNDLGREIVYNPLVRFQSQWEMNLDQLESSITPRSKLVILVNPHNPSGKVYRRDELMALAELVLKHDLWVISDEIHCDLIFSDAGEHIPFASLGPEIAARTVTTNSATKSHNLGGIRCSLIHYGSEALKQRYAQVTRGARGWENRIGPTITSIAWRDCEDWLDTARYYIESNRDWFYQQIKHRMPAIQHLSNQATYLAWLDCQNLGLQEEAFEFFVREACIGPSPGPDFGPEGRGCIRVNFATSRQILEQILNRMEGAIYQLEQNRV